MSENENKHSFHIDALRSKVKNALERDEKANEKEFDLDKLYENNFSWNAISDVVIKEGDEKAPIPRRDDPLRRLHLRALLHKARHGV